MLVNEIFFSIQGEGRWAGLPNIFIRFTGCNLRCSYCDTKYAYENGKQMEITSILNEIKNYPCKNICITGGEPLLQKEIWEFIDTLIKNKYKICLETNGSLEIKKLIGKKSLFISLDIKCPSSEMSEKMVFNNISLLGDDDQIKFIIKNREDYEYAKDIIAKYSSKAMKFFQPVWGIDPKYLSSWILSDGLDVKLGLQFHKIIWGDKKSV